MNTNQSTRERSAAAVELTLASGHHRVAVMMSWLRELIAQSDTLQVIESSEPERFIMVVFFFERCKKRIQYRYISYEINNPSRDVVGAQMSVLDHIMDGEWKNKN